MADLSPLAQSNLKAMQALSASISQGAAAFAGDAANPENHTEDALTGDEFLHFLSLIIRTCVMWHNCAGALVTQQPEFQEWKATEAEISPDTKPGLND